MLTMERAFVGSEAIANGALTRGLLRSRFAAVHPDIYLPKAAVRTLHVNTVAAWLWTGRRGVIAGRAAAALHGARWIGDTTPIELIAEHTRPRPGVIVHEERIMPDEICDVGDLPVTTVTRTALDLARWLPRDAAVAHLDALAAATGVTAADVFDLAGAYPGARGIRRARIALGHMDGGAQSPKETWLRLLVIDANYSRPATQIRVSDGFNTAYLDLGWDEPRIGLDYEGAHHRDDRNTYVRDIGRYAMIDAQGWIDLRVVAEHSRGFILRRLRDAFRKRGLAPPNSASGS